MRFSEHVWYFVDGDCFQIISRFYRGHFSAQLWSYEKPFHGVQDDLFNWWPGTAQILVKTIHLIWIGQDFTDLTSFDFPNHFQKQMNWGTKWIFSDLVLTHHPLFPRTGGLCSAGRSQSFSISFLAGGFKPFKLFFISFFYPCFLDALASLRSI